jgi:hypothetical protein
MNIYNGRGQLIIKKWQATHIAPLQPPILAAFLPWGGSAGAGRVRPANAKVMNYSKLIDAIRQTTYYYRMILVPACTR